MFSPLDDPQLEQWFVRFNAPLKRLPAEERAALHLEVRQHLEALAAANEELGSSPEEASVLALEQFGDPKIIGKRLSQEWRQGRTGFRADMAAIFYGFGLQTLWWVVERLVATECFARLFDAYGKSVLGIIVVVGSIIGYGGLVLVNTAIGRKYPFQAIKGAFYAYVLWNLWNLVSDAAFIFLQPSLRHSLSIMLTHSLPWMPLWMAGHVTVAYFASVTKRGWYRPALADFQLTLPRRRPQLSR